MSEHFILQKFSARFQLLGSPAHLRICHALAVAGQRGLSLEELKSQLMLKTPRKLLEPLLREELIEQGDDGLYRSRTAVLRDLHNFVHPQAAAAGPEYPLPSCCWPHSA